MSDNDSAPADGTKPAAERNRISRRRLIQAAGAAGAVAAAGGLSTAPADAAPDATATVGTVGTVGTADSTSGSATAQHSRRTGTIKDLKHVVILMQENRSFDHYFGTLDLAGARGFGDKQVLTWQNGQTIYYDPNSRAEGYLLPYHADSLKYNAQNTSARNRYFMEADVPWHHAIAKAFTIGDHYFCSLDTSTSPNRIMMWAGTNDAAGTQGGPVINNNGDYGYAYMFKTYPETLQEAGVSWQIYVNNDTDDDFLGDYTDNTVRSFAAFNRRTRPRRTPCPARDCLPAATWCTPTPRSRQASRTTRPTSTTCCGTSSPTAPRGTFPRCPGSLRPPRGPSTRRTLRTTARSTPTG